MSTRAKIILLSLLLVMASGGTALAAGATIQAFHSWQQQEKQVRVGDVHLIRYWMTIPHVAHIYHVPENYLYQSLHIKKATTTRSQTLVVIAREKHQSVDEIINEIQRAIEAYQKAHPVHPAHPPSPSSTGQVHIHVRSSVGCEQKQSSVVLIVSLPTVDPTTPLWYGTRIGEGGYR